MKIISIVGARPQFIKAAAISRAIPEEHMLIHTGQHYDANMSDIFFQEMEIPKPDYYLGIGGCSQGAMTGRIMEALETVLLKEKPNWVIVYGDTNSTLAGALVAAKLHIPVAHIEAGLRSFNKKMPEEINRIVADHCSDLLFTPSNVATNQLRVEGIPPSKIIQVGDVMFDTVLYFQKIAQEKSQILMTLNLKSKKFALATIHRAENTNDLVRLREIISGLNLIATHIPVIFPLHPRTKKALESHDLFKEGSNIRFVDPVGYLDMIQLEKKAYAILTDSGGIQKEAYFLKTPCLTLRDETEWTELVAHGFNQLVPAQHREIFSRFIQLDTIPKKGKIPLYGNGNAAHLIFSALQQIPFKHA